VTRNLFLDLSAWLRVQHQLDSPRMSSRFVYMFKPLTGGLNGATACLFLERDTVLGEGELVRGPCEYAGGLSSNSALVEGYVTQRSKARPLLWDEGEHTGL
jgi:hypothetical protein